MNGGCMQKVGEKIMFKNTFVDMELWEMVVVEPLFKKLEKSRSEYVGEMLTKHLSLFDSLVFGVARKFEWNRLIGWYFKKKVSVLVNKHSFGVRIYQKEYCSEMLGEKNFINSKFKLN